MSANNPPNAREKEKEGKSKPAPPRQIRVQPRRGAKDSAIHASFCREGWATLTLPDAVFEAIPGDWRSAWTKFAVFPYRWWLVFTSFEVREEATFRFFGPDADMSPQGESFNPVHDFVLKNVLEILKCSGVEQPTLDKALNGRTIPSTPNSPRHTSAAAQATTPPAHGHTPPQVDGASALSSPQPPSSQQHQHQHQPQHQQQHAPATPLLRDLPVEARLTYLSYNPLPLAPPPDWLNTEDVRHVMACVQEPELEELVTLILPLALKHECYHDDRKRMLVKVGQKQGVLLTSPLLADLSTALGGGKGGAGRAGRMARSCDHISAQRTVRGVAIYSLRARRDDLAALFGVPIKRAAHPGPVHSGAGLCCTRILDTEPAPQLGHLSSVHLPSICLQRQDTAVVLPQLLYQCIAPYNSQFIAAHQPHLAFARREYATSPTKKAVCDGRIHDSAHHKGGGGGGGVGGGLKIGGASGLDEDEDMQGGGGGDARGQGLGGGGEAAGAGAGGGFGSAGVTPGPRRRRGRGNAPPVRRSPRLEESKDSRPSGSPPPAAAMAVSSPNMSGGPQQRKASAKAGRKRTRRSSGRPSPSPQPSRPRYHFRGRPPPEPSDDEHNDNGEGDDNQTLHSHSHSAPSPSSPTAERAQRDEVKNDDEIAALDPHQFNSVSRLTCRRFVRFPVVRHARLTRIGAPMRSITPSLGLNGRRGREPFAADNVGMSPALNPRQPQGLIGTAPTIGYAYNHAGEEVARAAGGQRQQSQQQARKDKKRERERERERNHHNRHAGKGGLGATPNPSPDRKRPRKKDKKAGGRMRQQDMGGSGGEWASGEDGNGDPSPPMSPSGAPAAAAAAAAAGGGAAGGLNLGGDRTTWANFANTSAYIIGQMTTYMRVWDFLRLRRTAKSNCDPIITKCFLQHLRLFEDELQVRNLPGLTPMLAAAKEVDCSAINQAGVLSPHSIQFVSAVCIKAKKLSFGVNSHANLCKAITRALGRRPEVVCTEEARSGSPTLDLCVQREGGNDLHFRMPIAVPFRKLLRYYREISGISDGILELSYDNQRTILLSDMTPADYRMEGRVTLSIEHRKVLQYSQRIWISLFLEGDKDFPTLPRLRFNAAMQTPFSRLAESYSRNVGIKDTEIDLYFQGKLLPRDKTPVDFKMADNQHIMVRMKPGCTPPPPAQPNNNQNNQQPPNDGGAGGANNQQPPNAGNGAGGDGAGGGNNPPGNNPPPPQPPGGGNSDNNNQQQQQQPQGGGGGGGGPNAGSGEIVEARGQVQVLAAASRYPMKRWRLRDDKEGRVMRTVIQKTMREGSGVYAIPMHDILDAGEKTDAATGTGGPAFAPATEAC
ncbi:unnamed protein product [Vitrella brassicaformis CCMP3155]|uniref:Ubiquitin-like domain-containing protein n=1 Tax=Vitrella brassicaformis (strain CCMP3155) TaxID=1169540 RepID=A0A0G4GQ13_VITBC|nr:unnamed protein product [Vitrella brassicaformis CCMP3155]|eukprot:CEM32470.1 unnamed protein product [Vitrella brassicaformis CCMP3155]